MLAFLEKIATGFWTVIYRVITLVTPFFTQSRYLKPLGRGLAWVIHIAAVVGVLIGLWFVNQYFGLDVLVKPPRLRSLGIHKAWLPILFVLVYILSWLGYWLWKLL